MSVLRLACFLLVGFLIYRITQSASVLTIGSALVSLAAFFLGVKAYGKLQEKKQFNTALADWNARELSFLSTNRSTYETGKEYEEPKHPYSYDLDLFAEGGLYAYLNRCSSPFGKEQLAADLLRPDLTLIPERQAAVRELADKIDFRQQLYAHGSVHQSRKKDRERLMHWVADDSKWIDTRWYYVLMLFPVATIGCLGYFALTESEAALSVFFRLCVLNLIIAGAFTKKIMAQLSVSGSVTKILQNYSNQLRLIENESFDATLLQQYQQQLKQAGPPASQLIGRLSSLFNYLETVINLVVSVLLNGLFLFHVHVLFRLGRWKKQHGHQIQEWLELIGRFEALGSFGNLAFNNPAFCMPVISQQPAFQAEDLGHLLVRPEKRICNAVSFNQQRFVILTGSNMSGKSTFLRTLGINLVLAKAGSVVCATSFECYPFEIHVSMRITDSLQDDASLFYAELKRLQSIIKALIGVRPSFIILDEILRGTNSNDKRNGTIALIRKLKGFNCFGMIATHDVAVAGLIQDYPDFIGNKAFESAIVDDELRFDYRLRDGVCHSLSASYLMKKMEII